MCRNGVNVDRCTRYAEAAMCGRQHDYAQMIFSIFPETQKARVFRNKSERQIEEILVCLSEEIRKSIIAKYYCAVPGTRLEDITLVHSSDNNRHEADLYHVINGRHVAIEVKFGKETTGNIGMEVFEKIFGTTIFSDATCSLVRKNWERTFISEGRNEAAQYLRLWQAINGAIDAFNNFNAARGYVLPAANQVYMEKRILNKTGDGSFDGDFMKFILDGTDFREFKSIPTGIGRWTINRSEKIDGTSVSRCNVFVRNYDTNVQIKYVLNWKNNYPLLGNKRDKVSAKLGFGSPNWNVWVTAEVSSISAS